MYSWRGIVLLYNYVYDVFSDAAVTSICSPISYVTSDTYIASPNFPDNYPPNQSCSCVVVAPLSGVEVMLEIVHLAVRLSKPCHDWLRVGSKKTCGTIGGATVKARSTRIEFHSDKDGGQRGFWVHVRGKIR